MLWIAGAILLAAVWVAWEIGYSMRVLTRVIARAADRQNDRMQEVIDALDRARV